MWQDKYIGIPFKANGRDREGLDCWGLVRLVYREQYDIELPSLDGEYQIEDDQRITELVNQYKEGWDILEKPESGSVVVFKIFGEATHVGIVVEGDTFIHVRPGSNTVTDSLTSVKWKNRVVSAYKYNHNASVVLNAVPHPLKTTRITTVLTPGMNLEEVYSRINTENNVDPELSKSVVMMVNGVLVPRTCWTTTVLTSTDVVEYRAVPGKEVVKLVALIAIAYFAPQIAFSLMGSAAVTTAGAATLAAGGTLTMSGLTFAGTLAAAGITLAGSYLINAIAPVRPPSSRGQDPGSPEQQYLIGGANNPFNPYGAIPVVLGKMRLTAPLGAKNFITYPTERDSYLNMLLIWGYGPLTLTDFRVGEITWDNYQFNTNMPGNGRITFDGKTAVTELQKDEFDKIYGNDVDQQYSGLEMVGPEYTGTGSGVTITDTTTGGTTYNWDRLTGFEISPPSILLPEIPLERDIP